ncbi:MAG: hypothetical protein WB615_04495 [Candidatus Tumulicola sp.]
MRTTLVICLALAQAATAQTSAQAQDPYTAVNAMRVAFSHVRSVTATERSSNGDVATVEYNFPNRFHITTARSQIILSGDMEYAKSARGHWMTSPNGAEHQTLLAAAWQLGGPPNIDVRNLYTIVAEGTKTIGTTLVRGFHLHDASGGNDETVWIGPDNLPVAARIEMSSQTIDIHYTNYNTSVLVATPL